MRAGPNSRHAVRQITASLNLELEQNGTKLGFEVSVSD
jgi:hypothetical protein